MTEAYWLGILSFFWASRILCTVPWIEKDKGTSIAQLDVSSRLVTETLLSRTVMGKTQFPEVSSGEKN